MRKLLYVISIDAIVGFYFFVVEGINELGFVFVTFLLMCLSVIIGILCRCIKTTKDLGHVLLWNVLAIPILCIFFVIVGDYWKQYKLHGDDIGYKIDYNSYHFELVLHGDKFYRHMSSGDSTTWLNYFELTQKKTEFGIGADGHYEKIGDCRYILVKHPEYHRIRNVSDGIVCKDTMLLSNDTLYYFFDKPIPIKRTHFIDLD